MSEPRIPEVIAKLELPHEIRDALMRHAFAHGLNVESVLEAFRAIYALGFYDGAIEGRAVACLITLKGASYDRH